MRVRILFLPDLPVDGEGDRFRPLLERLGLAGLDWRVEGPGEGSGENADYIAFLGRERAEARLGGDVRMGRQEARIGAAEVWVLPATAFSRRGSFYEGIWRAFAARVLGRDLAVRDEFKGMAPDEIKAALEARRHDFAVCCCNLAYDFNIGTVVRTANAFLAREVWIYGRRRWDKRGAMGSYHYENILHVADAADFAARVRERGYSVVVFEQTPAATPLPSFRWPPAPLLVFGQEGEGVPPELLAMAEHLVVIPQSGSIRSLNVGVAAAIAMYSALASS